MVRGFVRNIGVEVGMSRCSWEFEERQIEGEDPYLMRSGALLGFCYRISAGLLKHNP
jgi:hypothetical protein